MPLADRILERTPPRARPAVELVVHTVTDSLDDRLHALAAEVAFFVILSMPPLLLSFVGLIGYLGRWSPQIADQFRMTLLQTAGTVFAPTTVQTIDEQILGPLLTDPQLDVASLGFLITLWSASRALNASVQAVNVAYDLDPTERPGWKRRLASYGFLVLALVTVAVLIPALVLGPRLGATLVQPLGLSDVVMTVWRILWWPTLGALAVGFLVLLYHLGTPSGTPWRRDVPGAVLAVVGWFLGSLALRVYATETIRSQEVPVYRTFSAPLVLLLWVYVTSFVMLLGAELNAEIEKRWPSRPGPGDESGGVVGRAADAIRRRIADTPAGALLDSDEERQRDA